MSETKIAFLDKIRSSRLNEDFEKSLEEPDLNELFEQINQETVPVVEAVEIPVSPAEPEVPKKKKEKAKPDPLLKTIEALTNTLDTISKRLEKLETKEPVVPSPPVIHVHMPSPSKMRREVIRNTAGIITSIVDHPEETEE